MGLGNFFSGKSRNKSQREEFLGKDEWLIQYAERKINTRFSEVDYFIFGHRHLPIHWTLSNGAQYINLGIGDIIPLMRFGMERK